MGYRYDLTGQKFGRLTVVGIVTEYPNKNKRNEAMWECLCEYGKTVFVRGSSLRKGNTKSCGCYRKDIVGPINSRKQTIHGYAGTRIYKIWKSMMNRCYDVNNKNYNIYGGRGITVCEEWHSIENFVEWAFSNGYNDNLTIDRIDGNGGYCPINCRWADKITQNNNTSRNHLLTYNDQTMTIAEWARYTGLTYSCLNTRIQRGWNVEDALFTPTITIYKHKN